MSLQNDLKSNIMDMCVSAKRAARVLSQLSAEKKNRVLEKAARLVSDSRSLILQANKKDIAAAEKLGKSAAFIDRLALNDKRIDEIIQGLKDVAQLPDPSGRILKKWDRPNGLQLEKVSVPIGVICMIYESRPNVTSEAASLCFKAGNAVILKGGKESFESNAAIEKCLRKALASEEVPEAAITLVTFRERDAMSELLARSEYIDLVIPRGGEELIRFVSENSSIPVIKHYKGICHIYVDKASDFAMAEKVIINAKVQRPATCNAVETLLVHRDIAAKFLPRIVKALVKEGVDVRGCARTMDAVEAEIQMATEEDWQTEYLEKIISIRVVDSLDDALDHIDRYGSRHSDAIITDDTEAAEKFLRGVDSSAVFLNCSTRFNDGGQFGFGAEIGISTDKIHARGPMALEELTIYKYIVKGSGQIRT